MKYFKIVFILMLGLFMYACNNDKKVNEVLDKVIEAIPFEIDTKLDIPNTFNYQGSVYNVSFTSNDKNAIDNEGYIYKGFKEINTSINLKVSSGSSVAQEEVFIVIKALSKDEVEALIYESIKLDAKVKDDLILPLDFKYHIYDANLKWISSNPDAISNDGKVNVKTTKQTTSLSVEFTFEDIKYTFNNLYPIEVEAISEDEFLDLTANKFSLPDTTNTDLTLPTSINGVSIIWSSSEENIIATNGKFKYPEEDTNVEITGLFFYKGKTITKKYTVKALAIPHEERINLALSKISFPEVVTTNLNLPTKFEYNVTGTWKSSNPNIITDNGLITLTDKEQEFTITLTLKSGDYIMEKDYTLKTGTINAGEIYVNSHHYLGYAKDFDLKDATGLKLEGDRIVLADNATTGTYTSPIFKSNNFSALVGSWAAITSKTTTAELKVRVRVDGTWSKYFSYGSFGLGLQNRMLDDNDSVARLSDDELIINNSKTADAFQYQVVLKRDSLAVESAKLSLVSAALQIPNYIYNVDISSLPNKVEYDLPNLYQQVVPTIGNSICSPTSATMLLMYKGHTFEDTLPHREVAGLFYDHGNKIYGNWVFNTVGMSAYGENSYVKRIYSFEELLHHLATVGPVALSIKDTSGTYIGRYTTAGHLIVVSGYEITESGRAILVHDPNLPEVEWKYSEYSFNGFSRNVIYVVE